MDDFGAAPGHAKHLWTGEGNSVSLVILEPTFSSSMAASMTSNRPSHLRPDPHVETQCELYSSHPEVCAETQSHGPQHETCRHESNKKKREEAKTHPFPQKHELHSSVIEPLRKETTFDSLMHTSFRSLHETAQIAWHGWIVVPWPHPGLSEYK